MSHRVLWFSMQRNISILMASHIEILSIELLIAAIYDAHILITRWPFDGYLI